MEYQYPIICYNYFPNIFYPYIWHLIYWIYKLDNQYIQSTETELNDLNEEEESRFMATGLNIGLRPTFGIKIAKYGSDNIEGFLTVVGKKLVKEAFKLRRFERRNNKTREIYKVLQRLKNLDLSMFLQTKPIPQY